MATTGVVVGALLAGAACGVAGTGGEALCWVLPAALAGAVLAWRRRAARLVVACLTVGSWAAGGSLALDARARALAPPLRTVLDATIGGFALDRLGPAGAHDPVLVHAVLAEDATPRDGFVSLRASVAAIEIGGVRYQVAGGVQLTVGGDAGEAPASWRAGRRLEAPVTFRRPARHLNPGVPDAERALALDGTSLFGSIKSAHLVTLTAPGSARQEAAAAVRAYVRRAMDRHVATHDPVAGAIATAVLIGDRTGLPDEVRERLQAAGTYHVIAISGGNIAILAGLGLGLLALVGVRGRLAAGLAIALLLVYAQIVTAGPSVWRATLMAALYLGARLLDHRTPPWQTTAVAAAVIVIAAPLEIRDAGFLLTFGATAALLEAARRAGPRLPRRAAGWIAASVAASAATELALLPVSAQAFSRVTAAGLLLNLIAVPMMGVVQIAGLVVALVPVPPIAAAAGWAAYGAAAALVESTRLVDAAPWLALRVPPPGGALILLYYASLVTLLRAPGGAARAWRGWRVGAGAGLLAAILAIVGGLRARPASPVPLSWTLFDVGQGESMLLTAGARHLLIDAGGAPFGGGGLDVGGRVVAPALWARGVRRLDALLFTHGDPDHVQGVAVLLDAFRPPTVWEGIAVPGHAPTAALRTRAVAGGATLEVRRAGEMMAWGGARLRVLHPPEPDWERRQVRNDDSVVLEVTYGDVALLLTGDAGAEVERAIIPQLTPARIRLLKVGHHGSRTSTSRALLDAWRPQAAFISAGRGNTFGHPHPDVLARLGDAAATVFRTDWHGAITVETDGARVRVRTYRGKGR